MMTTVKDFNDTDLANDRGRALLASDWGKADPALAANGADHHTVLGHSLDVAACAYTLVSRNPPLRAQLAVASGITDGAVAMTFAAVCALHDVGRLG